jgi:hypothetical protein
MTLDDEHLLQTPEAANISQEGPKGTQQNPINLKHVNKLCLMNK